MNKFGDKHKIGSAGVSGKSSPRDGAASAGQYGGARQRKTPRKITASYLENAALYYLQRYASSSGNLRTVLKRKIMRSCLFHQDDPESFYPLIEPLITRYLASGLLNDTVYAQARVSSLRRQGLSRQAIAAKLGRKGLPAIEIEQALATIDADDGQEDSELAAALALCKRKKIGPARPRPLTDPAQAKKEMAVLARAGFRYDTARRALAYEGEDGDTGD